MSSERSTAYHVELTARARRDLRSIYEYIGAENSPAAGRWYNRLEEVIYSLDQLPSRGMRVAEDSVLRQLLHGNKPHIYRVIYSVDPVAHRVVVVHIRHGAQEPFERGEFLQ